MIEDYENACRIGQREYRKAIAEGRYPYPPVLDEILKDIDTLAEVPIGIVDLPIEKVVGTKTSGRTNTFSTNFMPILGPKSEFATKWSLLYDSQLQEGLHDPIKAYEYLNRFYVQEGNKRVSVCRYSGVAFIAADVIRVLPKRTEENKGYFEFLDYFKVCPLYDILFSKEGSYRKFAGLIGQDLEHPWPDAVMEDVKAGYANFLRVYRAKNGKQEDTTEGDAFLVYLTVYPLQSLMDEPDAVLSERVSKLRNEFMTETNADNVKLVEKPEDIQTAGSGIFDILRRAKTYTKENPLRAAFLYTKSPDDSGWIYGHELGRNHLQECFDGAVDTICFENCDTDEKIRRAIDAAAADGDGVVFTTSPEQMPETLRSAIHYPDIRFLNCSVNLSHNAVRNYYGRMYEAKFVMGALAASVADSHKIGYVADYPLYGTIANINAFAVGASLVDPKARIELKWSTQIGTDWKKEFAQEGITVISGQDIIKPQEPSREYGIYQMEPDGTVTNLAFPVLNWGRYYELLVKTILDGTYDKAVKGAQQAMSYWWGMSAGVIDVILSEKLPYYSQKLARLLRGGIITEGISPFDGELRSQEGVIRKEDSPRLTNEEIITMNWLCDNIDGAIPQKQELRAEAGDVVSIAGVNED